MKLHSKTGMIMLVLLIAALVGMLALSGCSTPDDDDASTEEDTDVIEETEAPAEEEWALVWSDEFDGDTLNSDNWTFDLGGGGFGNGESQYYTDRPENVRLEDSNLVIEARREEYLSADYTSSRLKTQELQTFEYGRIEARIKLPYGQGIWPAFWMLGEDIDSSVWPLCGEIDIMENVGHLRSTVYGTLHGPGYSGGAGVGSPFALTDGMFSEDFHVFAIEWTPGQVKWFVDDTVYQTRTYADVPGDWVYDHPFFIILNVAVGGEWPGYPNEETVFPQVMLVDYVRVYQKENYAIPEGYEGRASLLVEFMTKMQVTAIETEIQETDAGWQAAAYVTITDEDGSPVEGASVTGQYMFTDIEETLETNSDGIAGPFIGPEKTEPGSVVFCMSKLEKEEHIYDIMSSIDTCLTIEN